MIFTSIQSTHRVEPKRAFDYWRSTALARVDATPLESETGFTASRLLAVFDHGMLMRTRSSPLVVERQPQQIRRDGHDDVCLSLIVSGCGHQEQGNRGGIIGVGDIGLVSLDRPFVLGAREPYEELRLNISRPLFLAHVGSVEEIAGRRYPASALGDLFASYLGTFAATVERMSEAEAAHAFEGALHLLRGILQHPGERREADLSATALRSLAQAYIERRLHDPDLGPAGLCAALRVSRTRLYAAFAAEGGIAAAIRDARLDRAHRRLSSAAGDAETIAGVMKACGYVDAASFSRAFRRRFGLAPRDVRPTRR
ncbi:helix-turn-helix domain-containing protein [Methylobacterium durans]|uniref:helix-turn-helix domain-containing protein n=1 Tax=Methylobacterium durans TaxID=2202825 RepID=UPI002AFE7CDB|nr:helix-turn-helix domain-containing protein [Methylobacterium durans]MEA1832367.1 helix-turn-helix domain-containing protein [Methylobacterium durans]